LTVLAPPLAASDLARPSTASAGTPADIAARLERLPVGRWHTRARLILGASTFFDAFDVLAITFALPAFVGLWHMTPGQIGAVISAAFFGQLVGAIAGGVLAERVGRLATANLTIALFSVMSLACAFATGPSMLIVFRFIQGIGLGGEVPVATTYVVEMAPSAQRGRFYMLYQIVFVAGFVAAGLIGTVMVPRLGWQSMFYLGAAPALLTLVLRRALPESPRWLASRGRRADADAVLCKLEAEARLRCPLPELVALPVGPVATPGRSDWREMFSAFYRRRTFCVWAMWFCCFSTTYGLSSWLPTLYVTQFHLPLQQSLFFGLITNVTGVVGAIICALLIDRYGRRVWFIGGFILGGAVLLFGALNGLASAYMLLGLASAATFLMAPVSLGLNLYTPELFPTRIRAIAGSISGAWQRVAAGIGPIVIGALIPQFGLGMVFVYFGVLAILGGLITLAFAPETKGRRLDEIAP
jgi:putative MFS transporter